MSQSVVGRCRRGLGVWRHATAFVGLLVVFLLGMPSTVSAQEMRTVTGNVTVGTVTERPFPGVRVSVKGTQISTMTDTEGFFTVRMPGNAFTLVLTYLGYRAEEVMVPATNRVEVHMEQVAIGIEGIVVTALGFEREKKTLGYSVQDLQGDEVTLVPEFNIVDALHGVIAGVQVRSSGVTGGSSRIVIRGASSISGNNQPLFVVDGVPLNNSSPRLYGFGGIDYGNAINDIDLSNIESISILKGPTAAALYGSRASNGAIVITTKSGRGIRGGAGGLGMTASISFTAERPLRLPSYQNVYGQGFNGEFRYVDGKGGGLNDHADESWGPRLCPTLEGCTILIDQFTGPQQPWVAHPDNVRSFYRLGQTLNTNVAIARSSDRSHVRLSLTRSNIRGMSPGNNIERFSLAVKGGANITDRLITEASLNYIDLNGTNRPGTGYDDDNPQQSFTWFGRQVDMEALRNYDCTQVQADRGSCQMGGQFNWNHNYHNNPFWEAVVNGNNDQRDRMIGHLMLNYQVNNWLTATARVGRDWYRDHRKRFTAPLSLEASEGNFGEQQFYQSETNTDLILNATRELTSSLTLDATLGGNVRRNSFEGSGIDVSRIIAPGIYTIDNAPVTPDP
ncbi:MAG: TonB-dependent receptor plug domain-containing protein, partial [Gemmatimonadetes bacterium]|nr:TonB-dependent receptor plug domain-containing protein [Gemmatimonadota bacterium]